MNPTLTAQIAERRAMLDKIKEGLIDRLNLSQAKEQIDDDTPLFGSGLKLDSVDATEVLVLLDETFGVKVSEGTDPAFMRNVNSLVSFILERRSEQQIAAA